jgi:diguanylate cyclase (GGDEF)-like protein
MSHEQNKNKILKDYATLIHALIPEAGGVMFHNHLGKLLWRAPYTDNLVLTEPYKNALQNLLQSRTHDPLSCRVMMGDWAAYLLPISNDSNSLLGTTTILLPRDAADLPYKACHEKIRPALSALGRELILRRNLTELKSPSSAPDAEHKFLRMLQMQSRHKDGHEAAIREILTISVEFLSLQGATLFIPDRDLRVSIGDQAVSEENSGKILQQFDGLGAISEAQISSAHLNGIEITDFDAVGCWPMLNNNQEIIGLLLFSWPGKSTDISTLQNSLAGFVMTTIELVLERAFDPLTRLLNWPAFESSLSLAYANTGTEYTLMYLDIDQLHVVNDTFGRKTGDKVMQRFANILLEMLTGQIVTRITGDGFAVLLPGVDIKDATQLAENIRKKVPKADYALEGKTYRPTVSIGVSNLVRDADGVRGALIPAQISCQAAKDRGRNRVETYQPGDANIVQHFDDLHMIGSVRSAIEDGRLVLYAQPIVRIDKDQSLTYHEVLVRMLDDNGNPVEPNEFLGAVERYQLMTELDQWVASNAIRSLAKHKAQSNENPLRLAINLSGQSVGNDQFLDFLKQELASTDVPTRRLCFEVTESVAVQDVTKAAAFMEDIKMLGCEFALDDFGKGQSSFAYLKRFPLDKLKIDGGFIANIINDDVSRVMVKAIVDVARAMNIQTVAEYVQDEATLEMIREIGIEWAQGYLIGAPEKLSTLLDNNKPIDNHTRANESDLPV